VLGASAVYSWSQSQYYVSDDGGDVVIFKGVKAGVPGVNTHHVAERTGLTLADLESYDAGRVRSGISADGLPDARRIIADLKVDCPTPSATAGTPAPTAAPTTPATPGSTTTVPDPCDTQTASPTPAPVPTTPAPTPAPTPGATPGATP
jgi:protein phosphatase